jgi:hypothetical protein
MFMAATTINVTNATLSGTFTGSVTYENSNGGGGGGGGGSGQTPMDMTIEQNTEGKSEAFALGVPEHYSWYSGKSGALDQGPPSNFTALTEWGQIYPEKGQPVRTGKIQIRNLQTWIRNKSSGVWTQVQDKSMPITGAYYVSDFSGNANVQWKAVDKGNGVIEVDSPPDNHNVHFWPGPRGLYPANTVNGTFMTADIRVMDGNMRFVVNIGGDWWLSKDAPFVQNPDGSMPNNPGIGMCNWIKLTTEWRTSYFTSSSLDKLQQNPPPPLR